VSSSRISKALNPRKNAFSILMFLLQLPSVSAEDNKNSSFLPFVGIFAVMLVAACCIPFTFSNDRRRHNQLIANEAVPILQTNLTYGTEMREISVAQENRNVDAEPTQILPADTTSVIPIDEEEIRETTTHGSTKWIP